MSKNILHKTSLTRISAVVFLSIAAVITVVSFLVDYQGLIHQNDSYFTIVGVDPFSLIQFYVAPWGTAFFFFGCTFLLMSVEVKRKSFRTGKYLVISILMILSLDVTYKTRISYDQYDFFAEFNLYPFPGLPFDLRTHKLNSFKDRAGRIRTADATFTFKTLYPETFGTPEPMVYERPAVPQHYPIRAPVPEVPTPKVVQAPKEKAVSLTEFECFPEDNQEIRIKSDGIKLIKEAIEPGEKTTLHSLGFVTGGPCSGGEIFRKTMTSSSFPTKYYVLTFEGVLTPKDTSSSDLCDDDIKISHYIELNDRYIFLKQPKNNLTQSEIAGILFNEFDPKKLMFTSSERESLLFPPKEISSKGLASKLQLLCPVSLLEYGPIVTKLPSGVLYSIGNKIPETGVMLKFNDFQLPPALYSSEDLNAKINGYAFTGIVQVNAKDLRPLHGFELKVYTWKNKDPSELQKAFEQYKEFFKSNEKKYGKYQDFTASHPIIFWKDPLSRWQKFTKIYEERIVQGN